MATWLCLIGNQYNSIHFNKFALLLLLRFVLFFFSFIMNRPNTPETSQRFVFPDIPAGFWRSISCGPWDLPAGRSTLASVLLTWARLHNVCRRTELPTSCCTIFDKISLFSKPLFEGNGIISLRLVATYFPWPCMYTHWRVLPTHWFSCWSMTHTWMTILVHWLFPIIPLSCQQESYH